MRRRAIALVVVLAACGGGGDDDDAATGSSVTTTTAKAVEAAGATTTTAVPTTTTAAPGASTTTAAVAAAPSGGDAATAPAPIPPGTYRYRQTGSAKVGTETYPSPPEGKAIIDAADADGRQVIHRYIDPEGEPSDATMLFDGTGIFLVDTTLRMGTTAITCTFDPPLPSPAWPAAVGAKSSGHGECGAFTTEVKSEITEARTVVLDGTTYDAVVVRSTITTSGQVTSTSHQVDWFVPALRLSAHTESDAKGSFGAFTFESSGTSDLLSAKPTQ